MDSSIYQPKSAWYIVAQVMSDIDLQNQKHSLKIFQWVLNGYRELNKINILQATIKSTVLVLDENNEAFLPADYYDYVKIGVCVNGYLINYDHNDSICLDRRKECCTAEEVQCELNNFSANGATWWLGNDWQWGYMPYQHNSQYVAGIYGKGEGFYHGGYRIDTERGKIKFDSFVRCEYVVLEYQSSGGIEEGNVFIPDICIEPLRMYVHWQRCMFSFNAQERSQTDYFRRRYQREVKRVVAKINGLTMEAILSTFRASIHQLPKR